LFGLYNFLVDNVDNIGLANEGGFVGIYAKALGFLVLGQNAVGISMRFV